MSNKRLRDEEVPGLFRDGMTIGIGGWGSRRKPMALVRALIRSGVRGLTIVSFGGADVGMLCATGQAARVMHGFVSLDTIAIEPHFAAARVAGTIRNTDLDEAMLVSGLRAAAHRLPFEVTRAGLGSDAVLRNPDIKMIRSPYADGEELVAMPAIELDVALIHVDRADERGNGQVLGDDLFFDDYFAAAADVTIMSAESVVPSLSAEPLQSLVIPRLNVSHIVEAEQGAAPTACLPSYPRDEAFQKMYAASVGDWEAFASRYANVSHEEFRRAYAAFGEAS
ncbi:CoA transferase subunit A [Microbacterium sp. NC79]|uniref:CoA transferase subunit A n=1 Tax=Microbacterium sp. NC79 TaxID=2851009 RepID=UPI001C2C1E46|nr:CoA-transferase [Microbacterium sp. NC79]MBV0895716.1 acyl CoA--acetate/3-ketoacid CoA transferase subunit alpha [Microbacterium sp. NC79]